MSSPLPLRAHHGLCVQHFVGEGYSPEFTANMRKIIAELERGTEIVLKTECDLICAECPRKRGGKCSDAAKVYELDMRTLSASGLREGEVIGSTEFLRTVRKNIIEAGKQSEVCRSCEWSYLCDQK